MDTKCSGCGEPLPYNSNQPCPKCGDTRKTYSAIINEAVHVSESLGWQHIHEYYERNPILLPTVFVITIGSPFLGLILAGWSGVAVGLVIGLVAFFSDSEQLRRFAKFGKATNRMRINLSFTSCNLRTKI